jgi:hypothetical protein
LDRSITSLSRKREVARRRDGAEALLPFVTATRQIGGEAIATSGEKAIVSACAHRKDCLAARAGWTITRRLGLGVIMPKEE